MNYTKRLLTTLWVVITASYAYAQPDEPREKTTFQTAGHWKPVTDIRSDVVMCYGTGGGLPYFKERVKSWREHGYTAHYMTGIAWGEYQDYFTGQWDGKWHLDEGQRTMTGDTVWHGHMVPYIVPTDNFIRYFNERQIKPAIDEGIDAIFLEEPEFWCRSGYSEAFKQEWQKYYGFPWRPQHESAENTYLSNKLKYHLYYNALEKAFTYAKTYGKEKGLDVRCYVPTHSLLNYTQFEIVSPEASLASMPSVDGYIAQVWTGTSRELNIYRGKMRERVFETAFLEYGCMESMTAPTGRKMFFLTDPIEDRAKDWDDYNRNYQATFTAQLLYPHMNNYEVMPWPDRIYEGLYNISADSKEKAHIPAWYATKMQVMINTLNDMPLSDNEVSGSQGVSVLMANSLMFQRSPTKVEGYDDPRMSNFFGHAMPLMKAGIPAGITHLENVKYPETLRDVKVLLMSYSNLKPLDPEAHAYLAEWVRKGGRIIYSGRDDDPFQNVMEWWNQGENHFTAPSQHLFSLMQMPQDAPEGRYTYGKGKVTVIRQDPKEYVLKAGGEKKLMKAVAEAYNEVSGKRKLEAKNHFMLQRGPYCIAAVVDENPSDTPLKLEGSYIDLFDPELGVHEQITIQPGSQAFLYDLKNVDKKRAKVLAAASRQYEEKQTAHSYSFVSKSPYGTHNVMRIRLPKEPSEITVTLQGEPEPCQHAWDMQTQTLKLNFDNHPEGVNVMLKW